MKKILDYFGNIPSKNNCLFLLFEKQSFHIRFVESRSQCRRSRRLVVSCIATLGNYEYGFFWYFQQDGTIQFEMKLTGSISPGKEKEKIFY
jgi:Cu2+-containing amine oxidase